MSQKELCHKNESPLREQTSKCSWQDTAVKMAPLHLQQLLEECRLDVLWHFYQSRQHCFHSRQTNEDLHPCSPAQAKLDSTVREALDLESTNT